MFGLMPKRPMNYTINNIILGFFLILFLLSCDSRSIEKTISFYHWKSKAVFPESYNNAIQKSSTNKIYMHFFDVVSAKESSWENDGVFPTYVLKSVSSEYQKFDIVPVVYITNKVFKTNNLDIENLSERIGMLINQISMKQFGREINHIQIDCDWTSSTKFAYFEFLKHLDKSFEIDVTIRLHQIKYQEKTGVPPVSSGTLMLYNVGDLKNQNQNSTLESEIVENYIYDYTEYPRPLNLALPLFSQTVVTNNRNEIKLINTAEREMLENDSHFRKIDNINFKVVKDTLYRGFFLYEGYNLKLEEISVDEILASYRIIEESNLNVNEIIFYHLDEDAILGDELTRIIDNL